MVGVEGVDVGDDVGLGVVFVEEVVGEVGGVRGEGLGNGGGLGDVGGFGIVVWGGDGENGEE